MTTGRFISLLLLGIITSMVWWFEDLVSSSQEEELRQKNNRPDFYMENFTTHNYNLAGKLKYQAQGSTLTHYPKDDSLEIQHLDMQAYKEDEAPFLIMAHHARITEDGEQIFLSGDVRLRQNESANNDLLSIRSEKLFIDDNRDYMETNKAITIKTSKHEMSGIGMQAWTKLKKYRLLSKVRGKHEP